MAIGCGQRQVLQGRKIIKSMIRDQKKTGTSVFLTTHNMFIADQLCDRVAFLNEGEIVAMDSPRKLKLRYGERSVEVEYSEKGGVRSRIFLILWGCATFLIAVIKPKALWQMGKIQGFVKILGDFGTVILFIILGIIAVGGGIALVILNVPG